MSDFRLPSYLNDDDDVTHVPKRKTRQTVNVHRLRRVLRELASRRNEALRLYQPTKAAAQIHYCMAPEVVVRGSNRAGKTTVCAAELAYIATSSHPVPDKYPQRDGIAYIVGYDGDHLGRTLFKKMFKPGAFKVIKDKISGKLRPWDPNDPDDAARRKEARKAPPLIPKRYIKQMNYEKKGEQIPSSVQFTNGWWFYFHSSKSHPEQGTDIDLLYIDEGLEDETWYVEGSARLVDRCGRMLWSATEQDLSDALTTLQKRAEECFGQPDAKVVVYTMLSADNPYLPKRGLEEFAAKLTDDQYEVRIGGQSVSTGLRIFPELTPESHAFNDDIFESGLPPETWANFAIIDPGFNPCAVLFASTPPPEDVKKFGDICVLWDEIYLRRLQSGMFGDAFAEKAQGIAFESFIIDAHGALRAKDYGTAENLLVLFEQELAERNIRSRTTGSGFEHGSNNVRARILKGKEWMKIVPGVGPKIRTLSWKLPNFLAEGRKYRFKQRPDGTVDDMPYDRNDHLMDCVCMLAQHGAKYHPPKAPLEKQGSAAYRDHIREEERERREAMRAGNYMARFGPLGPSFDDDD